MKIIKVFLGSVCDEPGHIEVFMSLILVAEARRSNSCRSLGTVNACILPIVLELADCTRFEIRDILVLRNILDNHPFERKK